MIVMEGVGQGLCTRRGFLMFAAPADDDVLDKKKKQQLYFLN